MTPRFLLLLAVSSGLAFAQAPVQVSPAFATEAVGDDADDPGIWVNPIDPAQSRIYGTNKTKKPDGAIVAFDLDGKIVQKIDGVDRPNNLDVEYGFDFGGKPRDIVVATERLAHRLRIFVIDPATGKLEDVSGKTDVFEGESGDAGAPMGIGLYRQKDGAVYAVVSPKSGPTDGYLGQFRLSFNSTTGRVDTKMVRRFGRFQGGKEIESVCVDDEFGFVYYGDETFGIHKYNVAPEAKNEELALIKWDAKGDHEGIAIWEGKSGGGYLICTDQIPNGSIYHVFQRNENNAPVGVFNGGADETDGIEATSRPLGPKFPHGVFVAMNSKPRNFLVYDWDAIAKGLKLP